MVKLSLPLLDNTDNENENSTLPTCDPSQSIYDSRSCIKDFLFCSDDNPCPSSIPCVDRVCQCLPNTNSFITLTPPPVRMYTIGCNFNTKRDVDVCRDYEYGVEKTCLLNYCSNQVPCYAGTCDNQRNVCVNITSTRRPLPQSANSLITLGDDPFGTHKEGMSPVLIIMMAAGGVMAIALVGCIVRTAHSWTKTTLNWASKSPKVDADNDEDENENNKPEKKIKEDVDSTGEESLSTIGRMPSKFTGSHYMPTPPPALYANEISPFPSPLPSPHFSPYSQPNQSQVSNNSSLLNPFRHGADEIQSQGGVAIEMNQKGDMMTGSYGSLPASTVIVTPPDSSSSTPGFVQAQLNLRMSQSQSTLSHGFAPRPPFDQSSGVLHKSLSMQQLGSRPAPPPPTHSASTAAEAGSSSMTRSGPLPTISVSRPSFNFSRPFSVIGINEPSISLDSFMDQSSSSPAPSATGEIKSAPQRSSSTPSRPSSVHLQSGAERRASVTVVPTPQSMLKHSASVPQMFVQAPEGMTSPPHSPNSSAPAQRNLPAGFASAPVVGRFEN
ncbi:hypothetical protein BC939DRAFT_127461 [Gamsiella multidivaricata]|uniref:uncharacterized protein n=1 Tax=Gamsiella multidivaricata TaxID=101098 RepID=UPI00221F01E6|nr:uncharacterized protein BC939DRAFT_127461 [Gamsiella multidivaricata]KAI7825311.1 hypothetical protein BC939DRAFT_127461 [Gamsiella multidivaricata]